MRAMGVEEAVIAFYAIISHLDWECSPIDPRTDSKATVPALANAACTTFCLDGMAIWSILIYSSYSNGYAVV
ncbi:MAG: hypothetical protein Q3982_00285 [Phoenicibacter congonensis]|uniref:Uncharacterized protein n=1 Tax=Phoenicibacter congonensis TaxID=1944646 RepID=A0AA43RFX1_9ACTN|nr:hypothetical protein [Phoenicibacter congonensis]